MNVTATNTDWQWPTWLDDALQDLSAGRVVDMVVVVEEEE